MKEIYIKWHLTTAAKGPKDKETDNNFKPSSFQQWTTISNFKHDEHWII